MEHDFSIVFETDNPYWQRVLDIFAKNEKYEKKVVSNRNLHHKFPRSFSKMLGEPVDNDKDNLISLSLADHFLVHYYYYLLAKKGYRQSMATAFTFMAKKGLKYMTPDTAEAMAADYEAAVAIANQARTDRMKGNNNPMRSEDTRKKVSNALKGRNGTWVGKTHTEESKLKMSESQRSSSKCVEWRDKLHEMNKGQIPWNKGGTSWCKGKKFSEEHKQKLREAALRREAKKRGEEI